MKANPAVSIVLASICLSSCSSSIVNEGTYHSIQNDKPYRFNSEMASYEYGFFTRESEKLFFSDSCTLEHSGVSTIGLSWYSCKVTDCLSKSSGTREPLLSIYEYESSILGQEVGKSSIAISNKNHIAQQYKQGLDSAFDFSINSSGRNDSRVVLKPNNTALFYDFSNRSPSESVSPQYSLQCSVKVHKYVSPSEGLKIIKAR